MKKIVFSVVAIAITTAAVFAANGLKKSECDTNKPGCTCTNSAKAYTTAKAGMICAPGCVCTK